MLTTHEQAQLFTSLSTHRKRLAEALEDRALKGVKKSVIDKYSDQAHFIYELLQNADDVKATKVQFMLSESGLYFIHNGTTHFTISDPANEDEDSDNKTLGHINAIASIGNSTKYEAQIGKFGVGFKSVFQYTNTPHIYDPSYFFKIERFIVPVQLDSDHYLRKPEETLFHFPFDHNIITAARAYEEILLKLKTLTTPLLFLKNLTEISWAAPTDKGLYKKTIFRQTGKNDIKVDLVKLRKVSGNEKNSQYLYVFTRSAPYELTSPKQFDYNIAFVLGKDKRISSNIEYEAYCFFPTKEKTNLKFIIQAPFLLTDSRAGIKAGEDWNRSLVAKLAKLAADSLRILKNLHIKEEYTNLYFKEEQPFEHPPLIDDDFLKAIPTNPEVFTEINDKNNISFKPFYTEILNRLKNDELLPTKAGTYTTKEHAYLASDRELPELFTSEQLSMLLDNAGSHWVFTSITKRSDRDNLTGYIDGGNQLKNLPSQLIVEEITPDKISRRLTESFLKRQTDEWLIKFYAYLLEGPRNLWSESSKKETLRNQPIIRLANGNMIAPYDESGKHIQVYLPSALQSEFPTVKSTLIEDEKSLKFLTELGISTPGLQAEIFHNIIPKYDADNSIDTDALVKHFRILLTYFEQCPSNEKESFIEKLKNLPFCDSYSVKYDECYRETPSMMYLKTADLETYFEGFKDVYYFNNDLYSEVYVEFGSDRIHAFLRAIGVQDIPDRLEEELDFDWEIKEDRGLQNITFTSQSCLIDCEIHGLENCLNIINKGKSIILWNFLLAHISRCNNHFVDNFFKGYYEYFYYSKQYKLFEANFLRMLKNSAWLYDKAGVARKPAELTKVDLSDEYDKKNILSEVLYKHLGFKTILNEKEINALSEADRQAYDFGKKLLDQGYSEEDIAELERIRKERLVKSNSNGSTSGKTQSIGKNSEQEQIDKILKGVEAKKSAKKTEANPEKKEEEITEEDDYTKQPKDISQKVEKLREEVENEILELTRIAELEEIINSSEKYTFAWFKALLEIEYLNSYESSSSNKEISIQFSKVEKEKGTEKTLLLKHPSRYIPHTIEDIGDISVKLYSKGESKTVAIEVVNVKEYTLRAKLKSTNDISGIDLSKITRAVIDIKNPIFILETLKKEFEALSFAANYNLQTNLTSNIRFIFGPPGTGKTTHLSGKEIIPLMQKKESLKVLVLAPTNKAADVLVRKLQELHGEDNSYYQWLFRFGSTGDPAIEASGLVIDRNFEIQKKERCVVVTTIARFPYDGFNIGFNEWKLKDYSWDYIIFDEASMINVASIVYPLYKKPTANFIIGGDPFQIGPITTASQWKDENIYTLINLNDFQSPETVPHKYEVTNLTTQYRSTPALGTLFSKFRYNGILSHHRSRESRKPLKVEGLTLNDITIIKFPVNNFSSLLRPQRLGKTPYHIYSAIFTVELANYLSDQITKNHTATYRIGIICPYRAQATLIDKLIAALPLKDDCKVEIIVGTIHGFQGDECDIILTVFNPPPYISRNPNLFLNKQNILNVAISRARDFLVILIPDDKTENIDNLYHIQSIQKIISHTLSDFCFSIEASKVEKIMFGNEQYIIDNSFATTHQNVNVYSKQENKYEVRCEETAIDVQIRQ